MQQFNVHSEEELAEAVSDAATQKCALNIIGQGRKAGMGYAARADAQLSVSGLSGIQTYAPEELYITAKAGTPLAEINAALRERGQMLAFEPPFSDGTLGGLVAAGLSGPRRFRSGGVRDHVLGFRGVSGRGEIFKSGGTVVKNVTGYDLSKLMAGSWGILAVMSEITLKVLPAAPVTQTLVWPGLGAEEALTRLRSLWRSVLEPTALAFAGDAALARFEGVAASVQARIEAAQKEFGAGEVLDGWQAPQERALRVTLEPTKAAAFAEVIGAPARFEWAGGLALVDAGYDQAALQSWLSAHGGGLTYMNSAQGTAAPMAPALLSVQNRLKDQFDPARILCPGRLHPEIGRGKSA